jgi:large subunit ribosomal protein L29
MVKRRESLRDLRAMADADLIKEMDETHRQLFTTRLQVSTRQLANTSVPRRLRRRISQIKTIQRERALAAAHVGAGVER